MRKAWLQSLLPCTSCVHTLYKTFNMCEMWGALITCGKVRTAAAQALLLALALCKCEVSASLSWFLAFVQASHLLLFPVAARSIWL